MRGRKEEVRGAVRRMERAVRVLTEEAKRALREAAEGGCSPSSQRERLVRWQARGVVRSVGSQKSSRHRMTRVESSATSQEVRTKRGAGGGRVRTYLASLRAGIRPRTVDPPPPPPDTAAPTQDKP